jgi:hypothetical protein
MAQILTRYPIFGGSTFLVPSLQIYPIPFMPGKMRDFSYCSWVIVMESWDQLPTTATLPAMTDQAGAIILNQLVAAGGCTTVSVNGTSCATGNSYVVNAMSGNTIAPAACPAPRIKPVLAPNLNGQSSNFASQVFMLLGTYNTSLWQDGNGLERGEVVSWFNWWVNHLRY